MNGLFTEMNRRIRSVILEATILAEQVAGTVHQCPNINIYHCCIQKSGSQWIKKILSDPLVYRYSGLRAFIPHKDYIAVENRTELEHGFHSKAIITPFYVTYSDFQKMPKPEHYKAFWVMRDPRDLIISRYFSLRFSHSLNYKGIARRRNELEHISVDEGITLLLRSIAEHPYDRISFSVLRDWLKAENDPNVMILKYEYLVGLNQKEAFEKIFDFCGIQMPRKEMNRLLDRYSFKKLSGRRPGEEDHRSHYRKGTPGDWRSHFTPEHASLFKKMTGDLVVQLGYEKANNW